jgi:hypothetical protein
MGANLFRAAANCAARDVGTRGQGSIPDIPPGASALAAPHQQFCGLVHGGLAC